MTKDRILLIISIAILGIVAALLFKKPSNPPDAIQIQNHDDDLKRKKNSVLTPVSVQLSAGKRAVAFKLLTHTEIIPFLIPGEHVGITFMHKSLDSLFEFRGSSLTILKNIKVLFLGREHEQALAKTSASNAAREILLEMSPKEAEIFFYAQATGELALVLSQAQKSLDSKDIAQWLLQNNGNFYSAFATYVIQSFFPDVDIKISTTSGFALHQLFQSFDIDLFYSSA